MLYKDRLVMLRNRIGLTQKEIANYLEIDSRHYGNCEREYEIFSIKHLNNLCNYYDVSMDYVFSFTENKQYINSANTIDNQKVGQRLKEFRKENKLTQVKLAKILNIGNGTLSGYESGDYLIATPFLYDICKKYNISADYLLGKIDSPKYLNSK